MWNRRQFLVAGAGAASTAAARYRPRLAVQTYVWTQVLSASGKSLADGIEEIFASSRRAGYRRIELVTEFVRPPLLARTSALRKKYGFEAPVVYAGGPMHEPALAERTIAGVLEVAAAAKSLGARIINSNPNPKPGRQPKTDEELAVQAKFVGRLGQELRGRGMRLILHHHAPEMADNAREWRHLLRSVDPRDAGLCIDVDWIARGGQDQLAVLREAGRRTESLHLRNARGGVWTESLGEGDYPYPAVAALLKEIGFTGHLVVELAHEEKTRITRPLEENLRLSREYAVRTFGL